MPFLCTSTFVLVFVGPYSSFFYYWWCRVQMGECLKTMIYADYPEQWPHLLDWVKHNLQDQQVYGALFVLRILSSKYELVCFIFTYVMNLIDPQWRCGYELHLFVTALYLPSGVRKGCSVLYPSLGSCLCSQLPILELTKRGIIISSSW